MKKTILFLSLCLAFFAIHAQNEPYKNTKLTPLERANDLLSRLTLEEKIGMMEFTSQAVPRLNIEAYNWWNEALHGVGRAGLATVFPQAIGMAATFDNNLVNRVFTAVSDEARAKNNYFKSIGQRNIYQGLTFWTPNINIFRDPRWGRGQETYGEDPYLTGQMGMAVVNGLQGPKDSKYNKLHACAKHFAVHSGPEWNRHSFNAEDISQRDLWETYLPAFRNLVVDAGVKEVMCAYNRFEGEPCCGSKKLLIDILRNKWNYQNLVVSDCWAINDFFEPNRHGTHPDAASATSDAVLSGTDLECGNSYGSLLDGVKKGLISEEQINVSVRRLLVARFELGEFDSPELVPWTAIKYDVVNSKAHQDLALETARKSIVLLQNKNNILPLSKSGQKIAVMGPNALDTIMQWGNYEGTPAKTISILDGIKSKIPNVVYEKGCDKVDAKLLESCFNQIRCNDGKDAGFSAEYWNTKDFSGAVVATQIVSKPFAFDNGGATVFAPNVNLKNFSAMYRGTFRPIKDGTVVMYISANDGFRLNINGKKVLDAWDAEKRETMQEYSFFAKTGEAYSIEIEYYQTNGAANLKMDMGYPIAFNPKTVVNAVTDADIIVFVGGISPRLEGEEMSVNYEGFKGGDRTSIELPSVQRKVVKALKEAGKKIVFVNCSGSAVGLQPESENCDAIVQAWYPGQAGGQAVADVLFGDYNPAGRLPVTFYKNTCQLPDFEDYSMQGRTYRYMKETPLFPFGHGLSYTTFTYTNGKLSKNTIKVGEATSLSFTLKNTGKREGDEVVQVYIRNTQDVNGPSKTLRAFQRISLKAGETKNMTIDLPSTTFECFDEKSNSMKVLSSKYEVFVGGSSDASALQKLEIGISD